MQQTETSPPLPNKLNPSPWLNTAQAADFLGCTSGTLKTWRCRGTGPRFRAINHKLIRYHMDDLNAFVLGQSN